MDKMQDAFRTIGEVAEELDLPQHVLRFWETKFSQIRPVKRAGGRRYYRPDDVQLVAAIRVLLYSEGYTIRGVQRLLKEQGAKALIAASRANGRGLPPVPPDSLAPAVEPMALELAADFTGDDEGAVATRLSPQDRHRMEAILAELAEGARILQEARRS
ncbi:MerR family transcriptional regulator [Rhodoblastus sp.]|uniref:MerR family transcriptional regulator n=1 Tax=Rhodoblastus sp. TaxID=1962975 RepID=UPI003F99728C